MKVNENTHFSGALKEVRRKKCFSSSLLLFNVLLVSSAYCGVVATGGNVMRIHNDYIHTFTESGTFTVVKPGTVQVLVVGGGTHAG